MMMFPIVAGLVAIMGFVLSLRRPRDEEQERRNALAEWNTPRDR